jgi:hypothetical protein
VLGSDCGVEVGVTTGGLGLFTGAAVGPGNVVEPPPGLTGVG